MPYIAYEAKKLRPETRMMIETANEILEEYAAQGFDLTLRQLFYQHVARAIIPNTERSYKKLGTIVSDGRLAGLIDWDHIVDRTRNMRELTHWNSPSHIIGGAARSYKRDLWATQDNYVEVWIEKDALVGVIQGVCQELDTPYFSCRGYTSQSEMWSASQRLLEKVLAGKQVTILHLGDHDPSGIDMTRDIAQRLGVFIASDYVRDRMEEDEIQSDRQKVTATWNEGARKINVNRIALTMAQIRQYNPPPNPAKVTDSRAAGYIRRYGHESWELDALEPTVLAALIRRNVEALIDDAKWDAAATREVEEQKLLQQASRQWEKIVDSLDGTDPDDEQEDEDAE